MLSKSGQFLISFAVAAFYLTRCLCVRLPPAVALFSLLPETAFLTAVAVRFSPALYAYDLTTLQLEGYSLASVHELVATQTGIICHSKPSMSFCAIAVEPGD